MPPPCLPRHLRPCRRLWSAHQVRFASDKPSNGPSTAGGDAWKRARSLQRAESQNDLSSGTSPGSRAAPASDITAEKLGVHSRNGRWRRGLPTMQPANSNKNNIPKTQAQRMREALGAGSATRTSPQLKIKRHVISRDSERVQGAITSALKKRDELQEAHRSGASTETEDELRDRLKKLEEQLALLQQKLRAGDSSGTNVQPTRQPQDVPDITGTAKDQPTITEAGGGGSTPSKTATAADAAKSGSEAAVAKSSDASKMEKKTLAQQIQAQSSSMRSSSHQQSSRPMPPAHSAASDEVSEQSLLDELFPEASSQGQPDLLDKRPSPPKLDLPAPDTNPHIRLMPSDARTDREKAVDAFRKNGEQTTILQLSHCSTALTEADFRRLIPKGLHIESWSRDGEFYKIIPGRDPLSLERLPFYYLLFHTPASALAYQKNASRLSKVSALHAPSSIHSAVPPPAGFLENGEDIHAATSSFVLHPMGHMLNLRTVMQPYNQALRALIDAGGYAPIVPQTNAQGKSIYRVLMHIDGYEPSHWDLWQIISRHAYSHGIIWPFRDEHPSAVRRLRDVINLRTVSQSKFQEASSVNPRSADSPLRQPVLTSNVDASVGLEYEDPSIAALLSTSSSGDDAKEVNQLVINRVYNRWIVEFEDEDAARRFAIMWHRVVLPDVREKTGAWREGDELRWVNAEYLW